MVRSKLVQRLAENRGLGRLAAEAVVDAVFDAIMASLRSGERVEIRGLGAFIPRRYPGYRGRNPKTGAAIEVKPKRLPHFKPSAELHERINRLPAAKANRLLRSPLAQPPVAGTRAGEDLAG